MIANDFWTSDSCHIAVNPHRVEESHGLSEWAAEQGMRALCFFQTSGSEGAPKWVALPKLALLISAQAVNDHFDVIEADRWLIALPLHHVGGFSILARAHLSGSSFVQDTTRWQPQTFVVLCHHEEISLVSLVPTQVHDLVRDQITCPPSLRAAIIGGGALLPELAERAAALGWPIYQSYGMTEAASQIATQPYVADGTSRLAVLPIWQTRVDELSRLILSGPALAKGYASMNAAGHWSWQPIGAELVTRDIVQLSDQDTQRFIQILGRESGYVKILGELIHLAPLQARLEVMSVQRGLASPPVILSLPDARRENRLVLAATDTVSAALLEPFNAVTEPLCQMTEAILVPHIPRTSLGKIDHPALQRLFIY
jgi:o-succinylbenzoate---CoA ligase